MPKAAPKTDRGHIAYLRVNKRGTASQIQEKAKHAKQLHVGAEMVIPRPDSFSTRMGKELAIKLLGKNPDKSWRIHVTHSTSPSMIGKELTITHDELTQAHGNAKGYAPKVDTDTVAALTKHPFKPGDAVRFRVQELDGPRRVLKGTIARRLNADIWVIEGRPDGANAKGDLHTVPTAAIYKEAQHEKMMAKLHGPTGKFENVGAKKNVLTADTLNARADKAATKTTLTENEVLTNPGFQGMMKRTVIYLASSNKIYPGDVRKVGGVYLSDDNFEFNDLVSEYMMGATQALRRNLANGDAKEIRAFEKQMKGENEDSRIFQSITGEGRRAVIAMLKERNAAAKNTEYLDGNVDESGRAQDHISDGNPRELMDRYDWRNDIDSFDPQMQDQIARIQAREMAIEDLVSTLTPVQQEVINRKYGLSHYVEPQGAATIAEAMKQKHLDHPQGKNWNHQSVNPIHDEAVATLKEKQGIDKYRQFLRSLRDHVDMIKSVGMIKIVGPGVIFRTVAGRDCYDFGREELVKSYSSDLAAKYPGGRWITVTSPGSPLRGRHLFIVDHKGGTATILSGGGPAMQHKTLQPQQDQSGKKPEAASEQKDTEVAKPAPKELPEERRSEIETARQSAKDEIKVERERIADIVRTHLGKEVELTKEDRAAIDRKVEAIADPQQKAIEKRRETLRMKNEKDEALNEILKQAKTMVLHEEPTATQEDAPTTVGAVVKEHAEQLLNHYYKIKALQREDKELNKILKAGVDKKMATDTVTFTPMSKEELAAVVSDEKLREKELDAHYKLVTAVRGYIKDGEEHKAKGGARLEENIARGGYEAITGMVGELTGSSIMSRSVYDQIGPRGAAALAGYYLRNSGISGKDLGKHLTEDMSKLGGLIAERSVRQGDVFMDMAKKVKESGRGAENLMEAASAHGAALKYQNRAYETYAQAEGALNQAAELAYDAAAGGGKIEIEARSEAAIENKRKKLHLKAADVTVKKTGDGYTMTVKPEAMEKLISETTAANTGGIAGEGFSVQDIKDHRANTDDFHPLGIREYTPPNKNGDSTAIVIGPHQQAAIRMIDKQKRVYLNYEAGTGKSLTVIAAKAHIEQQTGKPVKQIVSMPGGGKGALLYNFAKEVEKFSGYKVAVIDPNDTPAQRQAKYNSPPDTIVVVNHDKMNFDQKMISDAGFGMVVADEAHTITQRDSSGHSQKSEGLKKVALGAEHYVAMSGTPTPSDISQLYFHANLINPEKFSNLKEFKAKYGQVHRGAGMKEKIADFMNRELSDHMITAKQGTLTKPDGSAVEMKLHTHTVKLTAKQRGEYKDAVEGMRQKTIKQFHFENRINQTLNETAPEDNGKYAKIKGIIDHHLATKGPTEKISLYTPSKKAADHLHNYLEQHYPGMGVVRFTTDAKAVPGQKTHSYTAEEKAQAVGTFKHDPSVRFSIHTATGTTGFNIQHDGDGGGATTLVAFGSGEKSFSTIDQFRRRGYRFAANRDVDFHHILTDTPYDLGTSVRLGDQSQLQGLIKSKTRKGCQP